MWRACAGEGSQDWEGAVSQLRDCDCLSLRLGGLKLEVESASMYGIMKAGFTVRWEASQATTKDAGLRKAIV